MTPDQIRIVQSTWLTLLPIKDQAAQLFYNRLFELDPSLRSLFHNDIRIQGEKLMQVIDGAVYGLNRFDRMTPIIQAMGRRHREYGVQDHHYGTAGQALLWTLEQGLGSVFTPEVKDAWTAVYAALATTMREAASGAAAQQAEHGAQPGATVDEQTKSRGSRWGGRLRLAYFAAGLGLIAGVAWSVNMTASGTPSPGHAPARTAAFEPARFLLNALLTPALDPDAVPLRWVDPRRALRCGPNTTIQVNGADLVPGTLVPDMPFELSWHAERCWPFGKLGPRIDGRVKLTVYREDWGFSATVEPTDLRVVSGLDNTVLIEAGALTLPHNPAAADAVAAAAACALEQRSCN